MNKRKAISDKIILGGLLVLVLTMSQCATKSQAKANLPDDILGLSIGMSFEDAQKRLEQIGEFERDERKQQQVWRLKNDPRYSHIALGFDANKEVRYLTAFVDKSKTQVRFSEIGDISKAKQEVVKPHYRYTWEVPASNGNPAYLVIAYGSDPEFLSSCSLNKLLGAADAEEHDE